jgi:protein tyrosine phosphatase
MSSSDDANLIIPRLWLGNARASMDEDFIRYNNIVVVFNCTKNLPFSPIIPIKYRIPVDDNLEEEEIRNMELWSSEIAFKIMAEYKEGNVILVHCMAGMQRSAASVAIMMFVYLQLHATPVMKMIKEKRANAPQMNDRVPFAYIEVPKLRGQKILQGEKIEHPEYIVQNNLKEQSLYKYK